MALSLVCVSLSYIQDKKQCVCWHVSSLGIKRESSTNSLSEVQCDYFEKQLFKCLLIFCFILQARDREGGREMERVIGTRQRQKLFSLWFTFPMTTFPRTFYFSYHLLPPGMLLSGSKIAGKGADTQNWCSVMGCRQPRWKLKSKSLVPVFFKKTYL